MAAAFRLAITEAIRAAMVTADETAKSRACALISDCNMLARAAIAGAGLVAIDPALVEAVKKADHDVAQAERDIVHPEDPDSRAIRRALCSPWRTATDAARLAREVLADAVLAQVNAATRALPRLRHRPRRRPKAKRGA